jgi:hypothetical protein
LSRIGFRLSDWCDDAGGSVKPCKERLETIIGQVTGQSLGQDGKESCALSLPSADFAGWEEGSLLRADP